MAKRHIELQVTLRAVVRGGDEYIPESTAAEEEVVISMPNMDNKYVVFPKIIEGATLGVIRNLQANVSGYLNKKDLDERRRKEFEQMQMTYPAGSDEDESEDDDPFGDEDEAEESESSSDEISDPEQPLHGGLIDFNRVAANVEAALQGTESE